MCIYHKKPSLVFSTIAKKRYEEVVVGKQKITLILISNDRGSPSLSFSFKKK